MEPFTHKTSRSLSEEERALIDWLLVNGSDDSVLYAPQVLDLRVVATCACGCPSIDLAPPEREERTTGPSHILADFDGFTAEGLCVGVILHAREGILSELEVYAIDDFKGRFGLPTIESLRRF